MKYKVKFFGMLVGRDIEKTTTLNFIPTVGMPICFYAPGSRIFLGIPDLVSYHEKGKFFEVKLDFTRTGYYEGDLKEKDIEAILKLWKIS
ncbi:MAG: hypothetical protein A2Y82_02650 [Candidatus Buchananbacteria bacterium RBG_13_36_9]|uniref:Uncharacterized protein n=1 Tax=Candidatus Buchananbacteria bacterium RBG_13_36_9 TaxID=1797530 RepID=A0A1G1XP72_9BACT|nr:MAG: hypothetical protein A2Y82_02650 [Candidatus Buchananbacteria bacterium RBG_13_36_9]